MLTSIDDTIPFGSSTGSESILSNNGTVNTLSSLPTEFNNATVLNSTWIDFDGVNDYLDVIDDNYETVSFWYKNSTTSWQNIINSSGTIYVNGSTGTALFYPLFYNGSDFIFGKINDTGFINVSIDEIRFYNGTINSSIALEIYNAGR